LDEPTAGLDPLEARRMRSLLKQLVNSGRTMFYSTHNVYEAAELADDLLVIGEGCVSAVGTVEELARTMPSSSADAVLTIEALLERLGGIKGQRRG